MINSKDKKRLGKYLRNARGDVSQRQTALAVGISNAALSDIENGFNFPSEILLLRILKHLTPNKKLESQILTLYGHAKQVPPPDISRFIMDNLGAQYLIREIMEKKSPNKVIDYLIDILKNMEVE